MDIINDGDIVVFEGGLFTAKDDEKKVGGSRQVRLKSLVDKNERIVRSLDCKFFWLQMGMVIRLVDNENDYLIIDIVSIPGAPVGTVIIKLFSVRTGGVFVHTLEYISEHFSNYFNPE